MQKEDIKFLDSTVFEGMTSIRAIINANNEGFNNRKIEKILFDKERLIKIHIPIPPYKEMCRIVAILKDLIKSIEG